jgi:hypothetical protein
MSGLSVLSDAQLMDLLRRHAPSAPTETNMPALASMTDAQLMQALNAMSPGEQADGRAPTGTDAPAQGSVSPDALRNPDAGDSPGQGESARSARAGGAIVKQCEKCSAARRMPVSRPARAHFAKPVIPPSDWRLADLRRLLLSGPAVLPLAQTRRPPRRT